MANSRETDTRQPTGELKWSSAVLMALGIGLIVAGIGMKFFTERGFNTKSHKKNSNATARADLTGIMTIRASKRTKQTSRKTLKLPSHYQYIADAERKLTVTEVTRIITEIRQVFPKNFKPALSDLSTLRSHRNAQISLLVRSLSQALSLTSTQTQEMRNHFTLLADTHFQLFSEKYQLATAGEEKRKYIPVSASEMMSLCQPSKWLKNHKLSNTCTLTEDQNKILMPPSIRSSSRLYREHRSSSHIHNPLTGTVSGFPLGAAPDFPVASSILPLTPNQGVLLQELMEKKKAKRANLLQQALILTREQLTISLLLSPETTPLLEKELIPSS